MLTRVVDEVYGRVGRVLRSPPMTERAGVYAVSLFVEDNEDEPAVPVVMVSVNTDAQVALRTPDAVDVDEARWNFAFWKQEPIDVIRGGDR